jgi:hypothetical protein
MKTSRGLLVTLILLCLVGTVMSQDVIVKKDQSTVMSKVLEITSTEIKYKKWNNQDGPTYSIDRSEVLSINYENGEVENFSETKNDQQSNNAPQVQYLNSYMTNKTWSLYLNGRRLSDNEIRRLVGSDSYQQYQKGRRLGQTGIILDVVGGTSLLVGLTMRLFNSDLNALGPSVINTPAFKTQIVFIAVGCASLGTGILLGLFGSENIENVAETYNKKHGNSYSFNISPSLIKCEMPQSQGNCGLGLTLSMNF